MFEKLKKLLSEELGVDEDIIEPGASFIDDLNVEPADLAELMTVIEREFSNSNRKLVIADEDIAEISTVQDLVDCLNDYNVDN